MKPYRYGIVAHFAEGKNVYGGQTIKTRNFADALEEYLGEGTVLRIDTTGWKKKPFRLILGILQSLSKCEETVILPADRGVFVIPYLVVFLRGLRKIKLHYVVIGGWLPEFVKKHKGLARCLKKFTGIYVETKTMKNAMEQQSFENVIVLPNFKRMQVLEPKQLVYAQSAPYKLCTFSRVLKEKGIEDAVKAVKMVNEILGRTAYCLDIYGKVDDGYKGEFAEFIKTFPGYIRYMGAVDGSRSTEIIKEYFTLLFPTYFEGEGYPGTLLDAFSAGVPVIASDWRYNVEIIGLDKGFIFETQNMEAFAQILIQLYHTPEYVNAKKMDCLKYAYTMKPENIIKIFCSNDR